MFKLYILNFTSALLNSRLYKSVHRNPEYLQERRMRKLIYCMVESIYAGKKF